MIGLIPVERSGRPGRPEISRDSFLRWIITLRVQPIKRTIYHVSYKSKIHSLVAVY